MVQDNVSQGPQTAADVEAAKDRIGFDERLMEAFFPTGSPLMANPASREAVLADFKRDVNPQIVHFVLAGGESMPRSTLTPAVARPGVTINPSQSLLSIIEDLLIECRLAAAGDEQKRARRKRRTQGNRTVIETVRRSSLAHTVLAARKKK